MEPLFNILNYVYQTKNVEFPDSSISDFFAEGHHFPQFVSMILMKQIPNLKKELRTYKDFRSNFKKTVEFLADQDSTFKKYIYCKKPQEMEAMLLEIFSKLCFPMSIDEIFEKSNMILKTKKLQFNNVNEIFCGKFMLSLLNVLTNGEVKLVNYVNEKKDFDKLIIQNLQKADVPICIDQNSFDDNHDLFLIQIQVIFNVFSDIISAIETDENAFCDSISFYESNNPDLFRGMRGSSAIKSNTPSRISVNRKGLPKRHESSNPITKLNSDYVDDSYVNAVNFIINDPSKKIVSLTDLFLSNTDNLFYFVSKVLGEDLHLGGLNQDEKINKMFDHLALHDKNFKKSDYLFKSKSNWPKFIKYLLKTSYFTDKKNEILFKQCNAILHDYQLSIKHFDDFGASHGSLFLPLIQRLNLINYGTLKRDIYPPLPNFSFNNLHETFEKFNIPFILDSNSLSQYNDDIPIMLQVKIILDKLDHNYLVKKTNEFDQYSSQSLSEPSPLLLTMNAIGASNGIHFPKIESVVNGNLLPLFVEVLLNCNLSDHIMIKNSYQLTDEESEQNIENVIQYLKTLKNKFKILLFDFKDQEKKISSALLLCKNLLNLFFIKKPRAEMLERANILIGSKISVEKVEDFSNGDAFYGLLHFLKNANVHFAQYDFYELNFDVLVERFKEANIPVVINQQCVFAPKLNEDFIFYQLKFYFDKFEYVKKTNPALSIVENFLYAMKGIQKMKILDYHQLAISIRAKNAYLKYKQDKTTNKTQSYRKKGRSRNDFSFSLDTVSQKLKEEKKKKEIEMKDPIRIVKNSFGSFSDFNPYDKHFDRYSKITLKKDFYFNNGTFTLKDDGTKPKVDYKKKLNEDLSKVKDRGTSNKKFSRTSRSHFSEKLYRIYSYDDDNSRWEFNQSEYNEFIKDNKIATNQAKTCLVLFFNSLLNDVVNFNANYLSKKNPILDQNKIIIYALSHNYEKSQDEIKPIFLLLNVPSGKENKDNITTVITQIYSYLYSISDIKIVLLNQDKVHQQIESTKNIDKIASGLNIQTNNNSKLLFLVNANVSSYDNKNNEALKKGGLRQSLKAQLPSLKIFPINFGSNDGSFHDCIMDLTSDLNEVSSYDILLRLQHFPQYQISGLYIKMKLQPPQDSEMILDKVIQERYAILVRKNAPDPYLLLLDEFHCFSPEGDIDFNQKYRYVIYKNLKENKEQEIKSILTKQLSSAAKKQIDHLKNIISSKLYWEMNEISIIKNSFMMFIEKAFFDIIIISNYGRIADLVYQDNVDVLLNVKQKNLNEINSSFADFFSKINERNSQMERDFRNDINKSTRYIMKEVENVRDVEVVVGVNGSIDSLIDQDF